MKFLLTQKSATVATDTYNSLIAKQYGGGNIRILIATILPLKPSAPHTQTRDLASAQSTWATLLSQRGNKQHGNKRRLGVT